MKVLRRRDEFIKLLSQSKKLRYPNRKAYGALDRQAKLQVRFHSICIAQRGYLSRGE